MHYHRKAREHWLRRPDPELGGMSYQQTLNSLATDRSRYLFEMQHNAKRTINGMRRWNYTRSNSMECKYEQLIEDTKMAMFTRIIEHLGFTPDEQEECRNQFWDVSLFGKGREFKPAHVRSGASRQWKSTFDKGLADEFIKEFGDILIELGYEMDHSWIESLSDPVRPPPATDN
jgi:hypothetical protein